MCCVCKYYQYILQQASLKYVFRLSSCFHVGEVLLHSSKQCTQSSSRPSRPSSSVNQRPFTRSDPVKAVYQSSITVEQGEAYFVMQHGVIKFKQQARNKNIDMNIFIRYLNSNCLMADLVLTFSRSIIGTFPLKNPQILS